MRQIGSLDNETSARALGDFLYVQGIKNEVEAESNQAWVIWVLDEDQVGQAQGILERFRTNPESSEFKGKTTLAERMREDEVREQKQFQKRCTDRTDLFSKYAPYGPGFLTLLLVGACVYVAILTKLGFDHEALKPLLISKFPPAYFGMPSLSEVRHGEFWRIFSPILIHYGPVHLLFNMMWLYQLGSMIEARQGILTLLVLTVMIAGTSNIAEYVFASHYNFGGMSGVVYGLFGYIWIRGKLDPASGLYMEQINVVLMLVWFVVCLTGMVGPIANVVHGVGLAMGALWGYISAKI